MTLRRLPVSRRVLLALTIAACGGTAPRVSTVRNTGGGRADGDLPALYAKLFVAGDRTFPSERVDAGDLGNGPVTERHPGTTTCTIRDVRAIPGGKIATLDCAGSTDGPSGTYVGTPTGLWRVEAGFDGDVATLDPKAMLLSAAPTAEHRGDKDTESGSAIIVKPFAGGWCTTSALWGGDEAGWTLCVREGDGLIGGHHYTAGGSTHDEYFGEVPRS